MIALVRHYNFDPEVKVWIFDTENEAHNAMVEKYNRSIEQERLAYADYDPDDDEHGVLEEKCKIYDDYAVLAWKNDCTWMYPEEYDYCEWKIVNVEEE